MPAPDPIELFPGVVAFGPREGGDEDLSKTSTRERRSRVVFDDLGGAVVVHGHEPLVEPDVGLEHGLLAEQDGEEPRLGTYLPSTARQTVNGVESSRPSAPQSQVQNMAATSSPRAETPVVLP